MAQLSAFPATPIRLETVRETSPTTVPFYARGLSPVNSRMIPDPRPSQYMQTKSNVNARVEYNNQWQGYASGNVSYALPRYPLYSLILCVRPSHRLLCHHRSQIFLHLSRTACGLA
jgi:hypothetical protein